MVDTRLFDLAGGKQNVENAVSAGWHHQPSETNDPGVRAVESFNGYQVAQPAPGVTVTISKSDHLPIRCIQLSRTHDGAFSFFGDAVCGTK